MSQFNTHAPTIDPRLGSIKQLAYVVDDLDQAIEQWHRGICTNMENSPCTRLGMGACEIT